MDSAEVFLFHFMLRCVRVFGEETGKTRRKGGVFGEEQLNGGCLVSCRIGPTMKIVFLFFFSSCERTSNGFCALL